jgi:tetratricopeptide (TPR) repeat protein
LHDPNLARARSSIGWAKTLIGRAEETEADVNEALRISPRDSMKHLWFNHAGFAISLLGQYERALPWLAKSIEENKFVWSPHFIRAACLAQLGRIDQARADVKAGLAFDPKFTIGRFSADLESDDPTFLAQRERLIDGMRLAGVPE